MASFSLTHAARSSTNFFSSSKDLRCSSNLVFLCAAQPLSSSQRFFNLVSSVCTVCVPLGWQKRRIISPFLRTDFTLTCSFCKSSRTPCRRKIMKLNDMQKNWVKVWYKTLKRKTVPPDKLGLVVWRLSVSYTLLMLWFTTYNPTTSYSNRPPLVMFNNGTKRSYNTGYKKLS